MLSPILLLHAVLFLALQPTTAPATKPADPAARLQSRLEAVREAQNVPALGIAIARGDETIVRVAGLTKADGEPVDPDDAWHIGSCTKAVTSLVAARLVDQGVIEWDATVAGLVPDLPEGVKEANKAITLRQLLSHTSGLPGRESDAVTLPAALAAVATGSDAAAGRRKASYAVLSLEPASEPGTAWAYCNGGYIVASVMLERAAGLDFEALVDREVAQPLNVTSIGWGPPPRISGHSADGEAWQPTDLDNPKPYDAAGRMHVSLGDWLTICRVLLDRPDDYLSDDARRALLEPVPGSPNYSLGWGIGQGPGGVTIYQHAGSNTVWLAQAIVAPDRDFVAVVACNAYDQAAVQAATRLALGGR